MPKKSRLSRKEFPRIRGLSREHGIFFVASSAQSPAGRPKVAVVVPKKAAAKASVRNLIKRRTRAALAPLAQDMPPVILMLHAKREAAAAEYEDLKKDIGAIMKKVRARHGA